MSDGDATPPRGGDDLSAEAWQQVRDLLARALRLEEPERSAYLDRACAHDPGLRAHVDRLTRADSRRHQLLDEPVDQLARRLAQQDEQAEELDPATLLGQQVGPFRVGSLLGRGGMGFAFRAERADGQFQHEVALKLLARHVRDPEVMSAFLRERQILAGLRHPYIATLHDGGITSDGRPWFAMELVEGTPLTAYCQAKQLGQEARLDLFDGVCAAVRHAHQNLIVHRDLKPSNILVTADGTVKLLDFGIARILDPSKQTGPDRLSALTPEYAAPEQREGGAITTSTDVYALGVVLREALTGERAVARAGAAALPSDLSAILDKATAYRPQDRYASVESFQDDVARFRAHLPVRARSASTVYRLGKFARRHRTGVGVATAAAALVTAGITTTLWQARRAAAAAARAEEVTALLQSVFEVSDPERAQGADISARTLLDQGTARIQQELSGQPDLRADMLLVLGRIYRKLGSHEQALALVQQALDAWGGGERGDDPRVATALNEVAQIRVEMGAYPEAAAPLEAALSMRRRLFGEADTAVATSMDNLAELRRRTGDLNAADSLARFALRVRRGALPEAHRDIAWSLNNLGVILRERGELDEAEALLRESLALRRRLYPEGHSEILVGLANLANLLRVRGHFGEAIDLQREALEGHLRVYGERHPITIGSWNNLASIQFQGGALQDAEAGFRTVIELWNSRGEASHPNAIASLSNLGVVLREQEKLVEARQVTRQAVDAWRSQLGPTHPNVAIALNNYALVLLETGELGEAERRLDEAWEIAAALPPAHAYRLSVATSLGTLRATEGRCAEARPLLEPVLERGPGAARPVEALLAQALCVQGDGQREAAEALLLEAHQALAAQPSKARIRAKVRAALVDLYTAWGQPERAAEYRGG